MANIFDQFDIRNRGRQVPQDSLQVPEEPLSSSSRARINRFDRFEIDRPSSAALPSSSSFLQTEPSAVPLPPEPTRFPTVSPESRQLLKKIPTTPQDVTGIIPKKETLLPEVEITARPEVTRLDPLIREALGDDAFDKAFDQAIHGNALRIAQDASGKAVDRKAANKFLKFRRALEDIRRTSGDPNSSDGKILMKFINRRVARKQIIEETRFDPEKKGATVAAAFFPKTARGVEVGKDFLNLFGRAVVDLITIPGGIAGAVSEEAAEAIAGTGGLPGATTILERLKLRGTPGEAPASELFAAPANVAALATGPLLRGAGTLVRRAGAERTGQFLQRAGSLGRAETRVQGLRKEIDLIQSAQTAREAGLSVERAILQTDRTAIETAFSIASKTGEFATAASIPTVVEIADAGLSGDELLPAQGAFMLLAGMFGEAVSRKVFNTVDPQRFVRDLAGRTPEIRIALEMLAANKDQFKLVKKTASQPGEVLSQQLLEAAGQMRTALRRAGIELGEIKEGGDLVDVTSLLNNIDEILEGRSFGRTKKAFRKELEEFRSDITDIGERLTKAKRGGNGLEDVRDVVFLSLKDLEDLKIALRGMSDPEVVSVKAERKIFSKLAGQAAELAEASFASEKLKTSFKTKKQNFGDIKKRLDSMRRVIGGNINDIEKKTTAFVKNMFDVDGLDIVARKPVDARKLKQFSDLNQEIKKFGPLKRLDDIRSGKFLNDQKTELKKRTKDEQKAILKNKDFTAIEKSERLKVLKDKTSAEIKSINRRNLAKQGLEINRIKRQIEAIDAEQGLFEKAVANEFLQRMVQGFPGSDPGKASTLIGKFFNLLIAPAAIVARKTGVTRQNIGFKLSQLLGLEISEEALKRAIPNATMRQLAIEGLIWNEVSNLKQQKQTPEIRQRIEDLQNESALFNAFGSENDLPARFREFLEMPDDEPDFTIADGGADKEDLISGAKELLTTGLQKTREFFADDTNGVPDKLNGFGTDLNDFFPESGIGGFDPENIVSFINVAAERNHDNPHLNLEEFKLLSQSVASRESAGNINAVSSAGARGLMQIMNQTADKLGLSRRDMHKPAENVDAGTRLLNELLNVYKSSGREQAIQKALAAYNGGQGRVNEAVRAGGEQWRDFLAPDNLSAKLEMNTFIDKVLDKFNSKVDLITAENGGVPGVGG